LRPSVIDFSTFLHPVSSLTQGNRGGLCCDNQCVWHYWSGNSTVAYSSFFKAEKKQLRLMSQRKSRSGPVQVIHSFKCCASAQNKVNFRSLATYNLTKPSFLP
jgi:hypothetical protein